MNWGVRRAPHKILSTKKYSLPRPQTYIPCLSTIFCRKTCRGDFPVAVYSGTDVTLLLLRHERCHTEVQGLSLTRLLMFHTLGDIIQYDTAVYNMSPNKSSILVVRAQYPTLRCSIVGGLRGLHYVFTIFACLSCNMPYINHSCEWPSWVRMVSSAGVYTLIRAWFITSPYNKHNDVRTSGILSCSPPRSM